MIKTIYRKLWFITILIIITISLTACEELIYELETILTESELTVEPIETIEAATAAPSPTASPRPAAQATATATPGSGSLTAADFDFYVLNLSWSPDYCATNGDNDPQQCSAGKKLGFVLHGLWPQYDKGYPHDCSNEKLPAELKSQFPGLYPSPKLYDHEWEKHGTCSGLSPLEYLSLSKQLKELMHIPPAYQQPETTFRASAAQLKQDFADANDGFDVSFFAPYCSDSGRFLKELYVCFSIQGQPTSCSQEIHRKSATSCGRADFLVRNIR